MPRDQNAIHQKHFSCGMLLFCVLFYQIPFYPVLFREIALNNYTIIIVFNTGYFHLYTAHMKRGECRDCEQFIKTLNALNCF